MSDQTPPSAPRRKGRSPAYPAIDLSTAVERAQTLWEREHHYPTTVTTILGHWGYGPKSGGGYAALAALKSFGLAEDEGNGADRRAWLTELAQDIVTAPNESARRELIRKAALRPPIHKELWDEYQSRLPSDTELQVTLMRKRGFTPSGAAELVSEWKRTMAFAGLAGVAGTVPRDQGDKGESSSGSSNGETIVTPAPTIEQDTPPKDPPADPPKGRTQRTIQVPYSANEWALIQASFPMTQAEWDQMIAVLEAMKPSLVPPPKPASDKPQS